MRTTLDIDDKLLDEVVRISGKKGRSRAVQAALEEYVRQRRRELLLELPAQIGIEENWQDLREAELNERAGPD